MGPADLTMSSPHGWGQREPEPGTEDRRQAAPPSPQSPSQRPRPRLAGAALGRAGLYIVSRGRRFGSLQTTLLLRAELDARSRLPGCAKDLQLCPSHAWRGEGLAMAGG